MAIAARHEELLTILQEECAEVIQAVSKIRRFGLTEHNNDNLIQEIGDIMGVIKALVTDHHLTEEEIITAAGFKIAKMERYMNNKKKT